MDKTIDMAREAGFFEDNGDGQGMWLANTSCLQAFEALVRADERARLQPKKIKAVKDEYCHGDERYYAND